MRVASLKAGKNWYYYSSFCSYRDSCWLERNITFKLRFVFAARVAQPFWHGRTCQGSKLVVFQLAVKQLITEGRSWIVLCLKETKVQIVPVCVDFSSKIVYAQKVIFEAQERLCSLALSAHPLFEQTLNRKKSLTCLLWSMHQGRLNFRWNLNDLNGPKW